MHVSGLGPRSSALERLTAQTEMFDLLVIGGGITGAGIALDAAARGMSVALVERGDFASGTSSKSSKLVHGGLRYLEQREFALTREASIERDLLRRLAPHLVRPIPMAIPIAQKWLRAKFGVGLWAYDALASFKNIQVHKFVDSAKTEEMLPSLPKGKVSGGFLFYDCQTDDVRLVMEVLVQARRHGAVVVNYTHVVDLDSTEDECRATIRDAVTNDTFDLRARRVIAAAGVWADDLERLVDPEAQQRLRPSKGVHLVFRRETFPFAETAAFIPDAERKRMLFVIPWLDSVLVGTTDTNYDGDIDKPSVDDDDRRYCLDSVNSIFKRGLTEDDIAGAYAGLRPLVAGKAGATADLSRRHAIYEVGPGILGITGGKLTTYRRMAADAVDRIAKDLGFSKDSSTRRIRLGSSKVESLMQTVEGRALRLNLPEEVWSNLVRAYGERALQVLDLLTDENLARPLVPGSFPIAVEALYCARSEMVVHASDFLARRTRLALTDPDAGVGDDALALEVLADELGWEAARVERERADHIRTVEQERGTPLRFRRAHARALPVA